MPGRSSSGSSTIFNSARQPQRTQMHEKLYDRAFHSSPRRKRKRLSTRPGIGQAPAIANAATTFAKAVSWPRMIEEGRVATSDHHSNNRPSTSPLDMARRRRQPTTPTSTTNGSSARSSHRRHRLDRDLEQRGMLEYTVVAVLTSSLPHALFDPKVVVLSLPCA